MIWSFAPIVYIWYGLSKLPFAWSTFADARAARTSSSPRPRAARAVGFTRMRTPGFCPPLIRTRPTPGS